MPRFVYLPVLIVFLLLVIEPLNKFAPVSGNQQLNKLSVPVGFLPDRRLHFWFFMTASALDSKNVSAPICLFEDKKTLTEKKEIQGRLWFPRNLLSSNHSRVRQDCWHFFTRLLLFLPFLEVSLG